jgi:hypothetical protein
MWELPISIATQGNHVFMWAAGVGVKRSGAIKAKEAEELARIMGINS